MGVVVGQKKQWQKQGPKKGQKATAKHFGIYVL
jgi:hypothetical protein